MSEPGRNEGFHVLDEFACEAIRDASVPETLVESAGRPDGTQILNEAVIDFGDGGSMDAGRKQVESSEHDLDDGSAQAPAA